jgi:hypothetical protein
MNKPNTNIIINEKNTVFFPVINLFIKKQKIMQVYCICTNKKFTIYVHSLGIHLIQLGI